MNQRDRFHQLAQAHFESLYLLLPVQATLLGIHSFDHMLGELSPASVAQFISDSKQRLQGLRQLDSGTLPPPEAIERDLVVSDILTNLAWFEQMADWRRDPNFYVDMPLYGLFALIVREFAPPEERMRSVLARLQALPDYLSQGISNVSRSPRVFVQVAIETAEGALQFFDEVIPAFSDLAPSLRSEVLAASGSARAAVSRYADYLKTELMPRASEDFAIGLALFENKLRHEHMLDLSAEQLRAMGKTVFADSERALRELAAAVDPRRSWPELVHEARNHYPTGEGLLPAYREELERLREFVLDREIVDIPASENLQVIDTPYFARSTIPYAAYMPPAPFEQRQDGHFWVTPLDTIASSDDQVAQLKEHCYGTLPLIALHEAYPGHHLQLVRSNEVSSGLRKHISSNLFAEGWAFYCEQMMGEAGYYQDWKPRLFQLKDQLWRAARVVIDVDLQTGRMSIDEAVRLLVDRVHMSEAAAQTEVRRYAMSPTQPMSYLAGKQQILDLRSEFSSLPQKQFHNLLLSSGTIPLKLVGQEMRAYATQSRA